MSEKHPATQLIRTQAERSQHREHSVPLYLTSSFVFPSAERMRDTFQAKTDDFIYSRRNNPNVDELVAKICQLEGADEGIGTATGMSAVFSSIAGLAQAGDHILASRAVFGATHSILSTVLPKWGISHTYTDPKNVDNWERHLQPNTKMIVLETPSNPGLQLVDLEKAGKFAAKHQLILVVDNCFATPYLQQPMRFGAHIVTHSATKFMDGQGRVLGGIIVGDRGVIEEIRTFCRATGPALSPFNAWTISKSLETLTIRMDRHCSNALQMAQYLEKHPKVQRVFYPFLPSHPQYELAKKQMRLGGGLVTFELDGNLQDVMHLLNSVQLISLTSNLGDTRTTITHPASTTHAKLSEEERQAVGIAPNLIRISVGLEDIIDLTQDLEQALSLI